MKTNLKWFKHLVKTDLPMKTPETKQEIPRKSCSNTKRVNHEERKLNEEESLQRGSENSGENFNNMK